MRTGAGSGTISLDRDDPASRGGKGFRGTVGRISEGQVERIDALFVQSAMGFTSGPGTVTLHGLTSSTVYFADRPRREIGHLPSSRFVELWEGGVNSLAVDPPDAVLSFLNEGGDAPDDAVVVLREPRLDGDDLTYSVDLLEGTLPARSGPCALFIDVFGRLLSPASVAGARRRDRPIERRL
jgi:hypothetical protein